MDRAKYITDIETNSTEWDFLIIGGGATGVGTAIESASRGYKVLLVEQSDFGKGTSSRSTKLAHGGVRYLKQGNISLVLEALKERSIMRKNAPHLVHDLPFVVPIYDWWEGPFYGVGLKIYDMLAGKEGFGTSELLSREETIQRIPTVEQDGLRGGVIYYDGQFDDARLLVNMVQTAFEQGGVLLNYTQVRSLLKSEGLITGAEVVDLETGKFYEIKAKAVINATGVFADSIRKLDDPDVTNIIAGSQGVHIVLDQSFLPGDSAIMVPQTDDGRVLFAVPWHGNILLGTTDTPVSEYPLDPLPLKEEVDFLLTHAARYLTKDPGPSDVKSVFAGLRPLVISGSEENTAAISRDHTINISRSGLITIIGGKWTTYRKMAEDVVDHAATIVHLNPKPSITRSLQIHGYHQSASRFGELCIYGSDAPSLSIFIESDSMYQEKIHPDHKTVAGEVIWSVRKEMARTIEDFLARRTRILLLDAQASIEMAPKVARLMAGELNKNKAWVNTQVQEFKILAATYLL